MRSSLRNYVLLTQSKDHIKFGSLAGRIRHPRETLFFFFCKSDKEINPHTRIDIQECSSSQMEALETQLNLDLQARSDSTNTTSTILPT